VPRIVDHHQRRREVSAATLRVVVRDGLSGVTIRAVARESGWSTGVLNHYFENKQALLFAALREAATQGAHNLARIAASKKEPLEMIRAMLEEFLPLDERRRGMCEVFIYFYGETVADPTMAAEMRSYHTNWRALVCTAVVQGQADGSIRPDLDPVLTAEVLVAVTDGFGLQASMDPVLASHRRQRRHVQEWLRYVSK